MAIYSVFPLRTHDGHVRTSRGLEQERAEFLRAPHGVSYKAQQIYDLWQRKVERGRQEAERQRLVRLGLIPAPDFEGVWALDPTPTNEPYDWTWDELPVEVQNERRREEAVKRAREFDAKVKERTRQLRAGGESLPHEVYSRIEKSSAPVRKRMEKVYRMYQGGVPIDDMARKLNVHVTTVTRDIKLMGLPKRDKPKKRSAKELARLKWSWDGIGHVDPERPIQKRTRAVVEEAGDFVDVGGIPRVTRARRNRVINR